MKLISEVKHFISLRATFPPNLHLVEEKLWNVSSFCNINFPAFTSHLKQAALDSWDNTYFGLPYLSQESMVLSQLLLLSWNFSYSFTKSKIYSLCESLTNSFEVPKSGKTATKYINKSFKKSIIDIFIMYIISWVKFAAPSPRW